MFVFERKIVYSKCFSFYDGVYCGVDTCIRGNVVEMSRKYR